MSSPTDSPTPPAGAAVRGPGPLTPLKRIWIYNGLLTLVAAVLLLGPAAPHQPWGDVAVPWWAIAVGLVLVSLFPAQVHTARALTLVSASEVPLVVALMCTPSDGALIALLIARAARWLENRLRHEPVESFKEYFNLVSEAVEFLVAYIVAGALLGHAHGAITTVTVSTALILLLAGLTRSAVSSSTLPAAVLIHSWDRRATDGMVSRLIIEIPYSLASSSLGIVIAEGALGEHALLLAAALPTLGLLFFGGQSAAVRRDQVQADQLRRLSTELLTSPSLREATELLLRRACLMFLAGEAHLILLPTAPGASAFRSIVHGGGAFEPMTEMTLSDVDVALVALLRQRGSPLSTRSSDPPQLRDYVAANQLSTAMTTLVMNGDQAAALLVIGPRSGTSSGRYSTVEETTLATLAAQVGSVFENSRLTNQLAGLTGRSAELEHQAFHDPLTDLPNRALLMDRLGQALVRRNRVTSVGVLFLDLDNFKPINDTLGHAAGDAVLVAIAERLRHALRGEDTAARLGGDEFVLMLAELRDPAEVEMVAQRVLAMISEPIPYEGRELRLTASIGAATGEAGEGVEPLLARADSALYEAKHAGKGRVAVRHPSPAAHVPPLTEVNETAS